MVKGVVDYEEALEPPKYKTSIQKVAEIFDLIITFIPVH